MFIKFKYKFTFKGYINGLVHLNLYTLKLAAVVLVCDQNTNKIILSALVKLFILTISMDAEL